MQPLDIVNKYLAIIFVENNGGKGLAGILTDDFVFDDPFIMASDASDFISKAHGWVATQKSLTLQKQFVDGNSVCSLYTIAVQTAEGKPEIFELCDWIELRETKIAKEKVYFSDPVKFAKTMGFLDDYVKTYRA